MNRRWLLQLVSWPFFKRASNPVETRTPATATDRLNGLMTSVGIKAPVRAVSTGPLVLEGLQIVGGKSLNDGDRVLVMHQSNAVDNGIYRAAASEWARAPDFNGAHDVVTGTLVCGPIGSTSLFFRVISTDPVIGLGAIDFETVGVMPMLFYSAGNLLLYGADAAAIADSRGALASAAADQCEVTISKGRYRIASNLTIAVTSGLRFEFGAILVPDPGVIITLNCPVTAGPWQIFDCSAANSRITGMMAVSHMYAEWWGAKRDGDGAGNGTNDYAAWQACLRAAIDAGGVNVRPLPGWYRIDTGLAGVGIAAGNIYSPSIIGPDFDKCGFDFTHITAGGKLFQFKSPISGHTINKTVLSGVRLLGNGGTCVAVEFNGIIGAHCAEVSFGRVSVGVQWHNEASGSFSEYCEVQHCYFGTDVARIGSYLVTAGDDSFHGSGFARRNIVSRPRDALAAIVIGAGAKCYNAPIDLQLFTTLGSSTLISNLSTKPQTFHGCISYEAAASTLTLASGNQVLYTGQLIGTAENVNSGTLLRCRAAFIGTDESTMAVGAQKIYSKAITTGTNILASDFPGQARYIHVEFNARGYRYSYIYLVTPVTGGGARTEIQAAENTNKAGYGAPTFSVNASGQLVATNGSWPASGVTAFYFEEALGPTASSKQYLV